LNGKTKHHYDKPVNGRYAGKTISETSKNALTFKERLLNSNDRIML
jgi:hypothetical protein